jgi:HK97 family phage major capsid protein
MDALEERTRIRKLGMGTGVSLPGVNEGKEKFSLAKAIVGIGMKALGQDAWKEIKGEYEQAVLIEATQRALDTGTGGAGGGYVVPIQTLPDFIERLYANLVVKQAGATVLPNLVGSPVYIPKQLTSADIYWIGQNAPITLSNPTFGSITMSPRTMAARAQYSNLLSLLSNPNAEELMRRDFARIAALELDRVALNGAGTLEPVGISNMASIPTLALGSDGGVFDWTTAVEAEGMLEDASALVPDGKFAFITHGKVKRRLKLTRIPQYSGDPGGAYIVPPIISDRALADMLGYPIFTTSQVRTNLTKGSGSNLSEVYFGNFADLLIGVWGNLEILATNVGGNAWVQNAMEIRMIMNVDVTVRNLESVVYINDATTA